MKNKSILIVSCLLLLTSCSAILSKMYGIKTLKTFKKEECEKFVSKINFKNISIKEFYIDSIDFKCHYKTPIGKNNTKDFKQPIQILYFKNDSIVSFHANCYAKGSLTNIDWNFDNKFQYFPPKSAIILDSVNTSFKTICNCFKLSEMNENKKTKIVILWTLMLEKISKTAIEVVINNIIEQEQVSASEIYLINNDKSFMER